MKKFITTLAAALVIGSAASAATPTFNVVREEILPAMNRAVADADPFAEQIVGGIGPQLPYDPMRSVDYGFVQALKQLNADPFAEQIVGGLGPNTNIPATFSVYHEEVLSELVAANTPPTFNVVREEILPVMNRVVADADPYSEQIVGGIGPQSDLDPMRGVDYGFVQALLQQNADPFAEQIVGGIGPQSDLDPMLTVMTDWVQPASNVDPFSEEVVGGLGPQINFVASN